MVSGSGWQLPDYTIDKFFPDGGYPAGEVIAYTGDNLWRSTSAEKREVSNIGGKEDRN